MLPYFSLVPAAGDAAGPAAGRCCGVKVEYEMPVPDM
jgi:hypothetical protein